MKRIIQGMAILGVISTTALWAHHAAEGIISDDIWYMIDQNLTVADSPHLDFDPDNPGSLNMDMDVNADGRAGIASVAVIDFVPDSANATTSETETKITVDEANYIMETEFAGVFEDTIRDMGGIPTGMTDLDYSLIVDQDGYVEYAEVYLFEPLGQGDSQVLPTTPTPQPPGKRAGG